MKGCHNTHMSDIYRSKSPRRRSATPVLSCLLWPQHMTSQSKCLLFPCHWYWSKLDNWGWNSDFCVRVWVSQGSKCANIARIAAYLLFWSCQISKFNSLSITVLFQQPLHPTYPWHWWSTSNLTVLLKKRISYLALLKKTIVYLSHLCVNAKSLSCLEQEPCAGRFLFSRQQLLSNTFLARERGR